MRQPFPPPILRIGVRPDESAPAFGPRPRGSRRPHTDTRVAQVRRLIEQTPLTYGEIATRTGVGRANICRWTRDGGWRRHAFAPRATDTVPRARASARLKRRTLAARLDALAERAIRELEASACVDLDKLAEALELLKMAKLAARPRHGRRKRHGTTPLVPARGTPSRSRDGDPVAGTPGPQAQEPMRPITQLCIGDVDLHRAPRAAIEDFLAHREPPPVKPPLPRRSRAGRLAREHAWMLEKDQR